MVKFSMRRSGQLPNLRSMFANASRIMVVWVGLKLLCKPWQVQWWLLGVLLWSVFGSLVVSFGWSLLVTCLVPFEHSSFWGSGILVVFVFLYTLDIHFLLKQKENEKEYM